MLPTCFLWALVLYRPTHPIENVHIYIYIYIYIYTIVNRKIKVPTSGIYTIYYPVAVINDIH